MEKIQEIVNEIREYLTNIGPGEHAEEDVIADFANRIEKETKNECRDCEIAASERRLRYERRETDCAWHRNYIKQGEVMAETASYNVRLRVALKRIIEFTDQFTAKQMKRIGQIASDALKGINRD